MFVQNVERGKMIMPKAKGIIKRVNPCIYGPPPARYTYKCLNCGRISRQISGKAEKIKCFICGGDAIKLR